MKLIDLNCDLGEHESPKHRAQLMSYIQSANIACGGHAGNDDSMKHCIELARERGINIGAHPGMATAFGRGDKIPTFDELRFLLDSQVTRIRKHVEATGAQLHHIKLHGSLYHATDQSPLLAECYASWIIENLPKIVIFARSSGPCARILTQHGLTVWHECFLDRSYENDGKLTPRESAQAIIDDPDSLRSRLQHHLETGAILSRTGKSIDLACDTWCLHGDTPQSLLLAKTASIWRTQRGLR